MKELFGMSVYRFYAPRVNKFDLLGYEDLRALIRQLSTDDMIGTAELLRCQKPPPSAYDPSAMEASASKQQISSTSYHSRSGICQIFFKQKIDEFLSTIPERLKFPTS